jgi:hypothetical protein
MVLSPAEGSEGLLDAGDGEAYDVEVAAFDAGDVAAGAALDGVGAGFILGFFGGEVAGNFFFGEPGEVDERGLDEVEALGVGQADEGDAGEDGVGAAGKEFEHAAGVFFRARFAEDAIFEGHDGVGGDDDGGANGARGDEFGFGGGKAGDVAACGFVREGSFVDGGGEHGEGETGVVKNLCATRGCGGEDEFHGLGGRAIKRIAQSIPGGYLNPHHFCSASERIILSALVSPLGTK